MKVDSSSLKEQVESSYRADMQEAMRRWFAGSQEIIEAAVQGRAHQDAARDARGELQGRKNNNLYKIQQSGQPQGWDGSEDAWVFVYTHFAAHWHETGTKPHEIEADEGSVLAFEWPDAPPEVQEEFADTFPTVFYKAINHPGNPAIGFVRGGRQMVIEWLEGEDWVQSVEVRS